MFNIHQTHERRLKLSSILYCTKLILFLFTVVKFTLNKHLNILYLSVPHNLNWRVNSLYVGQGWTARKQIWAGLCLPDEKDGYNSVPIRNYKNVTVGRLWKPWFLSISCQSVSLRLFQNYVTGWAGVGVGGLNNATLLGLVWMNVHTFWLTKRQQRN